MKRVPRKRVIAAVSRLILLELLEQRGVVPTYQVICDASNNPPEEIADGKVNVLIRVPVAWLYPR